MPKEMGACVPFLPMPAWHLRSIKYRSLSLRRGDLRGKSTRITEGACKHVRAWDKQEICELYDCAHRQGSPRREHHALGFVSNSECSDFVSNKRNPGNGLFETSVFVVSCARLCRNRTVPAVVPVRYRLWALLTSPHEIIPAAQVISPPPPMKSFI